MSQQEPKTKIALATYIQHLRDQLSEAIDAADGKNLQFAEKELELELQVVVEEGYERKTTLEGKGWTESTFGLWVLTALGRQEWKKNESARDVQTIQLKLEPVDGKTMEQRSTYLNHPRLG
ncbi:MAG: trypco2 family protein [Acidobacteriota bacterium]